MKSFFEGIRNTILSGIIFLLPVFAVIYILQKVWKGLTGFGAQLAGFLGIKSVAGLGAASLMTSIILLLLFYGCGLLVRFAMIGSIRNWIERNMLQYIPGYLKYKVKMEEKLLPPEDARQSVLVHLHDAWKPGLLISTDNGQATVFLPGTPDTDNGEVWVVEEKNLRLLQMSAKELKGSLQMSGRGLRI
ncbi:MAG: hypothetical protein MUE58_02385 [Chitinophagaceae bacterium]|jgi:uncharacterized membrane protein|nr:hypothetical protein [Chitinophagaceae bacterium]